MRRSHEIDTGGVVLHVDELGSGPELVLLHGFTGDSESMRVPAITLARHWRTLRFDLVGHGRSDAPNELAAYTMASCVTQLDRVCDELEIANAHWLGYSMGGRAALALACARPERVRSLVLVGASAGIACARERADRVSSDEALAQRILGAGLENFVDYWMGLDLFASQKRLGAGALAAARAQRLRNRPHGLSWSLRGMGSGAQPPLLEALPTMERPVLLAVGDEDPKFLAIAERLAATLPDARIARIPEAGHAAHLEQPEAFARTVACFLNEIDVAEKARRRSL